jgi:tetratricopeptide (TPR) repeat protein/Tol biopolymer transport system component
MTRVVLVLLSLGTLAVTGAPAATIAIDYPADGSIFPPDIIAPTFLWRDPDPNITRWRIEVTFLNGGSPIRVDSRGERMEIGEIDPRCVSPTNELPKLTAEQAAAHTWKPDAQTWNEIKLRSAGSVATVTISNPTGSQGHVTIQTSRDPVGAPIFYRDVPLMPSEVAKGVIKPLAPKAVPLIAWRLRNVAEPRSRVLMEGLHTCANCHSFSRDGKTLGIDVDGPQNDKGLYALVPIRQQMAIRNEDVIAWSSFSGKLGSQVREGFMSQVSPDGQYVVTTIKPPGTDSNQFYYVANFTDYRFLQVFYPTRGILVWYNRTTRQVQPLPGADDPRFVQANAVWSPDGKYLVFARAEAKAAYPQGARLAEYANDPNETPIQYDLYRIPFNGGKGGRPEPIAGASRNGMSNSFPKISPDGRWIVFVQARNGQLMRPDGQLYMVPVEGGEARRMRCNTPLMNSWHSFSPNGRWMVFSSKSRSPYTQMFLTHIGENGEDSPAILIENSTAANRAVNIPEFVNIPPDGMLKIDTPATEFYRLFDVAKELADKGDYDAAISAFNTALQLSPDDVRGNTTLANALTRKGRLDEAVAHYRKALDGNAKYLEARTNLGAALAQEGKVDEAISQYRMALEVDPRYPEAQADLGVALFRKGHLDEAIAHFEAALEASPSLAEAQTNLGVALIRKGDLNQAIAHFEKALAANPDSAEAHTNLGVALLHQAKTNEAIPHLEKALTLTPDSAELHTNLGSALAEIGRFDEAIPHFEKALALTPDSADRHANLGSALAERNRLDEAIVHFQKALALTPDSAAFQTSLGAAMVRKGKSDEAIPHFEKALALNPNSIDARFYLGNACYLQGRTADALTHWRQVLRAQPDDVPVLNQAAWVLATDPDASLRNAAEAVEFAERAVRASGGRQPRILATLAASYAEAGQYPKAVDTAQRGLEIATEQRNAQLVEGLGAMIALYRSGQPFRQKR